MDIEYLDNLADYSNEYSLDYEMVTHDQVISYPAYKPYEFTHVPSELLCKSSLPFTHDQTKLDRMTDLMQGVNQLTEMVENVFRDIDMPTITQAEARTQGIPANSIQTILFDRHYWTIPQAKAWLRDHKYKRGSWRRTANEIRFIQVGPIQNAAFYSKKLPNQIVLIFQEY